MVINKSDKLKLYLNESGYMRALHESDVTPLYVEGLNDPEVNRFLVGPRKHRQTIDSVKDFVHLNREAEDSILFGLYVNNILRGTLRLHGATSTGIYLGLALFDKNIWSQGWGRLMITTATQYALNELGVKRVMAGIYADNMASQKSFQAAGFVHNSQLDKLLAGSVIQSWQCV